MTEVVKVELPEDIVKKFKKKAMELYGYKKGSIKAAMEDAINKFITSGEVDWDKLKGVISSDSLSVELQHKAWNKID